MIRNIVRERGQEGRKNRCCSIGISSRDNEVCISQKSIKDEEVKIVRKSIMHHKSILDEIYFK